MLHLPFRTAAFRLGLTCLAAAFALNSSARGQMMGQAPDFPPGTFSDGGHYNLDDFHGKVVVLFFYDKDCPTCRGLIPKRNEVVEQFRDKPVKFIAVGPNDSMSDVISYERGTHLEMTTFADTMGAMEARYGFHISLQNIYQFRYIGPDGNIVEQGITLTPETVNAALKNVKWKYKDGGYDPHLNNVIELLEWNQYARAMPQLRSYMKQKATADSANKLYAAVKAEGQHWLDEANAAAGVASTTPGATGAATDASAAVPAAAAPSAVPASPAGADPVKAFDLYTKVSVVFRGDDIAKSADSALTTLAKNKDVQDELAARGLYNKLYGAMTYAKTRDRGEIEDFSTAIATKYPNTPTGKKSAQLAKDLDNAAQNAH